MDPMCNPFSPGAGTRPPELVGRSEILERSRILLGRTKLGRSEKSMILVGLRGVGKTVLLNEITRQAKATAYHTVSIEAPEDKSLALLLAPHLKSLLFELDMSEKVRRGLGVLKSFVNAVKVKVSEIEIGLDIDPIRGSADSGDLEVDLSNLFAAVGEAALDRSSAIAVVIDEIQYLSPKELSALIMAMHKMQQLQLPIVLVGAGLPILTKLSGESKSYTERLFDFPKIGELSESDSKRALQDPTKDAKVDFTDQAAGEIFRLTKGFPYFIQEWGYQAWNCAEGPQIALSDVQSATQKVLTSLDNNFFRVRFDRLTPTERNFMRAMAQSKSRAKRIGDIAEVLQRKASSLGPIRANLIHKGMIYSPEYGDIAFTVPLFDEFMHRVMPELRT